MAYGKLYASDCYLALFSHFAYFSTGVVWVLYWKETQVTFWRIFIEAKSCPFRLDWMGSLVAVHRRATGMELLRSYMASLAFRFSIHNWNKKMQQVQGTAKTKGWVVYIFFRPICSREDVCRVFFFSLFSDPLHSRGRIPTPTGILSATR